MCKGYKKYLALALSAALIFESQVMTVSATSSDLDIQEDDTEVVIEEEPMLGIGGTNDTTDNSEDFVIEDGVLKKYTGSAEDIVIPDGVIEIYEGAFRENKTIRSVTLSDSVKMIDRYAFAGNGDIETFIFSRNLENVAPEAFLGSYLGAAYIPSAPAFPALANVGINDLYFEDGIEEIPENLFGTGISVSNIHIPDTVTGMPELPSKSLIFGSDGSYAQQYAKENNRRFFISKLSVNAGIPVGIINFDYQEMVAQLADWTSEDEAIAVVNEYGVICGMSEGTCKIHAYLNSRYVGSCEVTVTSSLHVVNNQDEFQSTHDYENGSSEGWIYSDTEDIHIGISFSEDTELEESNDTIHIIEGYFNEVGVYTGKELAGKTIFVNSNNVIVRLESDESGTAYGFRIENIVKASNDFVFMGDILTGYNGSDEHVEIPYGVREIGEKVFRLNYDIQSVKLPDSVKIVGRYAFAIAANLREVDLGSVEYIEEGAFSNAERLENVVFPDTLKKIGNSAFYHDESLLYVILPENLETLGGASFDYCDNLITVYVPKNANIERDAFAHSRMINLYLEDGIEEVSDQLISRNTTISNIFIPESVISIPNDIMRNVSVIHGKPGSYAQQYADENNRRFFNTELSVEAGSSESILRNFEGPYSIVENEYVTFESDDESIATVDEKGIVYGLSEGTCRIYAKTNGIAESPIEVGCCVITVLPAARIISVSELSISTLPAEEFNGGRIQPKPVVKDGEKVLEEGKHYTLSYSANKYAGTGYVTITGIQANGYEGSKKISFKIKPFDITKNVDNRFVINYDKSVEYSLTGAVPKVSVYFNNADGTTRKLTEGKDYTVSYSNNLQFNSSAKPTISITAKGNFTGKKELQFTIKERDISKACMYASDRLCLGIPNSHATAIAVVDSCMVLIPCVHYENIRYVYAEKTVVWVYGRKVTRKAGDSIGMNDIIPADTTIKVIATAKKGSGYKGTISTTYKLYSLESIFRSIFG